MGLETEITIQNELSEIARVSNDLARLGADHALPNDVLVDLQIVVDEVLSNIINYAFSSSKQQTITIRLNFEPGKVAMEFIDGGVAFDPRSAPLPAVRNGLRERRVGGLGIHFVKALVDTFEYERKNGRNHLRLEKRYA